MEKEKSPETAQTQHSVQNAMGQTLMDDQTNPSYVTHVLLIPQSRESLFNFL